MSSIKFEEFIRTNKKELNTSHFLPSAICHTSATKSLGIDTLQSLIEEHIMRSTNRHLVKVEIPAQGPHINWLKTECTVQRVEVGIDHQLHITVVALDWKLKKFFTLFNDAKLVVKSSFDYNTVGS